MSVDDPASPLTAEALMRSRFEAFRDADAEWLRASWHPSTRPPTIDLENNPRWRGLQIVDAVAGTETDLHLSGPFLRQLGEVGLTRIDVLAGVVLGIAWLAEHASQCAAGTQRSCDTTGTQQ